MNDRKMPRKSFGCLFLLAFACLVACSSAAKIGEACTNEGSTEGCVEGAVCGKTKDVLVCMKVCSSQADCPSNSTCNGMKGDTKACRSNL